jgi:hypothetical protein
MLNIPNPSAMLNFQMKSNSYKMLRGQKEITEIIQQTGNNTK